MMTQLIQEALMVAKRIHTNQRYDIFPYEKHINDIQQILTGESYSDEIIIAGILHDSLEDSDLSYNDIKRAFGLPVAEMVYAVTDELGRNRKERKAKTLPKTALNRDAVAIKIADRIANIEHGLRMGGSMLEMYKKEHAAFKEALYRPHEHELLWERLERAVARI